MYGGDEFLRVSRFSNGYTVEIKDPAIIKYNKKQDETPSDKRKSWKDPWRSFVFDTAEKAQTFIGKNLAKAVVGAKIEDDEDEFGTAFDLAASDTPKAFPAPSKK